MRIVEFRDRCRGEVRLLTKAKWSTLTYKDGETGRVLGKVGCA